jgi:hypothetical protein
MVPVSKYRDYGTTVLVPTSGPRIYVEENPSSPTTTQRELPEPSGEMTQEKK